MKRFLLFLSLIFSLLLCVATHEVSAKEQTWYTVSADKVDNPVLLEDKEYYQGVSINSNVISDLTFLQIPFEKYLNKTEKQMQIITFSEALYKVDDNLHNEVVLYLYSPDIDLRSININTVLLNKELLQNNSMIDVTPGRRSYHHAWKKVSNYESIYKFSFSIDATTGDSIKKILLHDYSKTQPNTLVSTVFDAVIKEVTANDGKVEKYSALLKSGKVFKEQQFNFIYEKNIDNQEAVALLSEDVDTSKVHHTTSISYNETSANVDGKLFRLRYDRGALTDDNVLAMLGDHLTILQNECYYADSFYYFFNVKDASTGKAWSGKEVITGINYTYYEYMQDVKIPFGVSIFPLGFCGDAKITISYLHANGAVYASDVTTIKDVYSNAYEVYENGQMFKKVTYRDSTVLKNIYQTKTIEPETFENKFPVKKDSPSVKDYLFGDTSTNYIATMPYIFSTSDMNYVNAINKNIYSNIKTADFQYGMLVGKEAYPVSKTDKISNSVWETYKENQFGVGLVSVNYIDYEIEGEKYHATVSETIVDDSYINDSIPQGPNDLFPSVPEPEEPSWWEKLLEWLKENWPVLVFTAALILVIIIIFKVVNKIIDYRSKKAIIKMTNEPEPKKKKE